MNEPNMKEALPKLADALRYALLLEWGTRVGLGLLILSFTAYVMGWVTPHVPVENLPHVWNLSLRDYLKTTGIPTGWGWLPLAVRGDESNLVGIALLAGCSLPPLLGLIPFYLKAGDRVYATISGSVALVILLAASGILTQGH
jgi:hypothetical protein